MRTPICLMAAVVAAAALPAWAGDAADVLVRVDGEPITRGERDAVVARAGAAAGPALEAAERKTLAPHFSGVDMCEGNRAADVIATMRSSISYNPVPGRYNASVKVRFYSGDGKLLGKLHAHGQRDAAINSSFIDDDVRLAFEAAMQNIADKFTQDTALNQAIQASMQADPTHMPCSMVGLVPGK